MVFTRNVMYNQLCYIKFAEEQLRLLLTFLNFRGQHFRLLWQIKNYWWLTFSRKRQICFTVLNNRATSFLVAWREHKPTIPRESLQPCSCMQCKLQFCWLEQIIKGSNECLRKLIGGLDVLGLCRETIENFCLSWFFTLFSLWWICWQTNVCHQLTQVNKNWVESPYFAWAILERLVELHIISDH